ncbi:MAG: hypothetical protein LUG44_08920 [Clostridiales bacterium]|nr:hypothetical protein [Clostridiales bacterium]
MNPLLAEAVAQADGLTRAALGGSCPVKSRPSQRGTVANAAPQALGLDGTALAGRIDLAGSWFQAMEAEGGYLNFFPAPAWYNAAVERLPAAGPEAALPTLDVDFPAAIHPADWAFWQTLRGTAPDPALAARQDAANPGWLVRYTARRLAALEPRASSALDWTAERRQLLWTLVQLPREGTGRRMAGYLLALAREIWAVGPQSLPTPLNRHCQAALRAGLGQVLAADHRRTQ